MNAKLYAILPILLLAVSGCANIGSPFLRLKPDYSTVPETELRAAARAIEQAVMQGDREPQLGEWPGIVLDAPEISQALRARAARSHLIQELLSAGHAYEQKSGAIATLRTREYKRGTTRMQRDQHALLVMSENQNRWTLYESIVKESKWAPKSLGAVQTVFFEARREMMAPGQQYEDADGGIAVR